jgi:asparagine synthase (glutamine-hydrolysing)
LQNVFTDRAVDGLLRGGLTNGALAGECAQAFRELQGRVALLDPLSQALYVDAHSQLPDQLLMKVDKMTMAASLEARCPFLDQAVVEYAASLPAAYKRAGRDSKRVLRLAVRGLIPDSLLGRPKHGFEVPVRRWMLGGLHPFVHDLLLADRAAVHEYLEPKRLRGMWRRLTTRDDRQLARQMWLLLNLAVWHRQHTSDTTRCHESRAAAD